MNSIQAKARADILKALGHPTRVLMLDALSRSDCCLKDLRCLVAVSQPTLSRHLAWLKRVGLVSERRAGPRVLHHLECPCILKAIASSEEVIRSLKRRQRKAS